jgi:ankyrin repeat protein
MIVNFRRIAKLILFFSIVLNTIGTSSNSRASNLPQYEYGLSEKNWQFDTSSGISVYVANNSTVGEPSKRREMYILLDKEHFDKENLVKLFAYYADKYSDPVWLTIKAFSDREYLRVEIISDILGDLRWEAIPTSFKKKYGLPLDISKWKSRGFYAWYWRDYVREYFDYTPNPDKQAFDRVTLKQPEIPSVKEEFSKPADIEIENQKGGSGRLLLGSDSVNSRDEYGWPQLVNALKYRMFDTARVLIEKGADVNACAPGGQCPLAYAARAGFAELVELLIARGAKVNFRDKFGDTALMEAAGEGKKRVVTILLKHGADMNAKDALGRTALMKAWDEPDKVDMVELLLKAGADIEAVDDQGDTALMYAVRAGRLNTVKLLLKWGAKADAKNVSGQTAMDYAKIAESYKSATAKGIISALQQALAK